MGLITDWMEFSVAIGFWIGIELLKVLRERVNTCHYNNHGRSLFYHDCLVAYHDIKG
jgi:hypothetical protein